MKRISSIACLVIIAFSLPSVYAESELPDAEVLLKAVDKALFLESYASTVQMVTIEAGNPNAKIIEMDNLARRQNGTYIELTAPARSKGTRFLQLEGSLWIFNPKSGTGKALRLSARDNFQGSTFANSDVGKSQYTDDYKASLLGKETLQTSDLGAVECWMIKSTARSENAAYSSIVMWLRTSDSMPLKMEYYAKSGLLFKRMTLSQIKNFGAITRPSVMKMESLEKAGTYSTLTIQKIEAIDVPITVFNKNWLSR